MPGISQRLRLLYGDPDSLANHQVGSPADTNQQTPWSWFQSIGADSLIVPILSVIFHHPQLTRNTRNLISSQFQPLLEKLGQTAYEAAWDKGKGWVLDEVVASLRKTWS